MATAPGDMQLTLLGTGDVRQVPVWGCECKACQRAVVDNRYRRRPCSALLETGGQRWLLDAGLMDLAERFPPGALSGILLTHYHVDHVQGLFHLRWGLNHRLAVFGPEDAGGCADLHKHPGILAFRAPLQPFQRFELGSVSVTALPMIHSKPTLGYLFEQNNQRIAYLTDTVGLPDTVAALLAEQPLDLLVIDCSRPPQPEPPRNHNDLNLVRAIHQRLRPARTVLTHIGHELDGWLMKHRWLESLAAEGIEIGRDGVRL
ncbi:MAG: phosphonate metabolism protein PhnP [Marinobacterium sp.]|nr:phosphonate metabolism protein PhnP [Marinobacterium sp.]